MDPDVYEGLVRRLEAQAEKAPALFRGKVLLICGVAYLALLALLLSIAGVLLFCFRPETLGVHLNRIELALIVLPAIPIFFTVLKMFFLRLPPPQGRAITRAEAPKLFSVLAKMRRKLNGPPIHRVLIDDRYNATVSQRPRWGFFGAHTNILTLGLPYLLGAPPNEMMATIAHEYGHLCGNHGRLAAWVYRQRRTFRALHRQVGEDKRNSGIHALLALLLDRFMPYYNAYTFVLSRQNEYDADLTATELVGAPTNAASLIRDALLARWIREDFWPTILRQVDASPRPPLLPYASMRAAFRAGYPQWATPERLAQAWAEDAGLHDTHPALRDRVEATGERRALPKPAEVSAAEVLLGATVTRRLVEEFDDAWWSKECKAWEARHRHVQRSRGRLQELGPRRLDTLAPHELQELALLTAEFDAPHAAKPILQCLLERPGGPFPKAAFLYGGILLDEGNDDGLDYLFTAATDRTLMESAADTGYRYLLVRRGEQAAAAWWEKIVALQPQAA